MRSILVHHDTNINPLHYFSKISETYTRYFGGGLVTKSCPTLVTPWTVVRQAPLSMGFSKQEYWSGLPFPSPGDLPDPGIKPRSPALQADFFYQLSYKGSPLGTLKKTSRLFWSNIRFIAKLCGKLRQFPLITYSELILCPPPSTSWASVIHLL